MSRASTTNLTDQLQVSGFTRMLTGLCTLAFLLRVLLAVTPETASRLAMDKQKPALAAARPVQLVAGW